MQIIDYDDWFERTGAKEYEQYEKECKEINLEPKEDYIWLMERYEEYIAEAEDRAY